VRASGLDLRRRTRSGSSSSTTSTWSCRRRGELGHPPMRASSAPASSSKPRASGRRRPDAGPRSWCSSKPTWRPIRRASRLGGETARFKARQEMGPRDRPRLPRRSRYPIQKRAFPSSLQEACLARRGRALRRPRPPARRADLRAAASAWREATPVRAAEQAQFKPKHRTSSSPPST